MNRKEEKRRVVRICGGVFRYVTRQKKHKVKRDIVLTYIRTWY